MNNSSSAAHAPGTNPMLPPVWAGSSAMKRYNLSGGISARISFGSRPSVLNVMDSHRLDEDPAGQDVAHLCSGCRNWQVQVRVPYAPPRTNEAALLVGNRPFAETLAREHARECEPLAMLCALQNVPLEQTDTQPVPDAPMRKP